MQKETYQGAFALTNLQLSQSHLGQTIGTLQSKMIKESRKQSRGYQRTAQLQAFYCLQGT